MMNINEKRFVKIAITKAIWQKNANFSRHFATFIKDHMKPMKEIC
jgi:hypothetical protein